MNIKSERADYFQPDTQVVALENVELILAQEREKVLKEISEVVGVEAKRLDTASQHGEFGSGQRDGIFYLDDAVQTIITKKLEPLTPTKTDKQ